MGMIEEAHVLLEELPAGELNLIPLTTYKNRLFDSSMEVLKEDNNHDAN